MKQTSLYMIKKFVIEELFGGHDESYGLLPSYIKVVCETNEDPKTYYSFVQFESIPRKNLFSTIFISFAAMWKGFLAGCGPLIRIDGTHLKGNYWGVLSSAVDLDGNNEIFPLAYAIVSVEDKEDSSYFLWNLYNIVMESSKKDWTIISDRQKVWSCFCTYIYLIIRLNTLLVVIFVYIINWSSSRKYLAKY